MLSWNVLLERVKILMSKPKNKRITIEKEFLNCSIRPKTQFKAKVSHGIALKTKSACITNLGQIVKRT